ncbi:DHS-like NAD/FAD-binding domain-containing protein [Xylaria longipes]|nr:DHS-like NAD/FAD-binding domain-containing protein [Xylaria longipes]
MPTLQVTPDTLGLLQNVADTLAKSRKMVIITGAGISTNSGIPDFRSENGLYSLIQDQFERAEANASATADSKKDVFEDRDGTPPTAVTATTTTSFDISERPLKRRRTSGPESTTPTAPLPRESSPSSNRPASRNQTNPQKPPLTHTDPVPCSKQSDPPQDQVAAVSSLESSQRMTRSRATILRPTIPRHLTQHSVDSSTSHDSVFSDQPPSSDSSQTDTSTFADTPGLSSSHPRPSTPRRPTATAHLTSSSPLSSPPPDLFDPYENANSSTDTSSHADSDCSDASESDDTQQSLDFFSSQASSSNLRNMKGRDLFDCNIWADPLKTSVFYRFATSLRQRVKEVEPTVTHRFIAQMRDVGKLARVYTQNIDEIEKKIGLSTDLKHGCGTKKRKSIKHQVPEPSEKEEATESPDDAAAPGTTNTTPPSQKSEDPAASSQLKLRPQLSPDKGVECVFLHGSLHSLRCFVCGKLCDWDEDGRESCTLSGEQPECPHCAGATAARQEKGKRALGVGKLRPDIVLYGEEHPQSDLISPIVQHDLAAGPDLLLVLGTSLRVHGLKIMVKEFAKAVHKKGGKVVFINFTKPSESAWGDVLDYWIEWDCDAWVEDLKTRKPLLWLSPDERLELDRQRREALAEKKREALRKRESIVEKKRDNFGDKREPLPEQSKTRLPPKNPVAMRNDYQCGAYVVWDIFQTLAKIGDRPFDKLGYTSSTSSPIASTPVSTSSPNINVEQHCEPGIHQQEQARPQAQKRNRKPLPERAPSQGQHARGQRGLRDSKPVSNKSSGPGPLPGAIIDTVPGDPKPTEQSTTTSHTKKPPAKKRKARKSAPATLVACEHTDHQTKPVSENKRPERHTGKDRYLKAVRELAKSRRTPAPRPSAISNRLPVTPGHPPLTSETHDPGSRPTFGPGQSVGQASVDDGNRRHSTPSYTSYSFQPWLLPPLPDPPSRRYGGSIHYHLPVPAAGSEFAQGPMLPPLHVNWKQKQSPPSKIKPLEIVPLVGPASPLAEKPPNLSASHYSYTWHHAAQPIYNDPLVGIQRQTASHKSQWHVDSNDDNTPSPSDQLRMEAANQLWQLRGRT